MFVNSVDGVELLREAADDLRLLVSLQGNQMKDADWLIVGLIAQKCAFNESAKAAYSKVQFSDDKFSAYSLKKKKISIMENNE